MKVICSVDRIETGDDRCFAVLIPDDGSEKIVLDLFLTTFLAGYEIKEGDVFEISFDGESPSSMVPLAREKNKRIENNASRLSNLFGRKNNHN